MEADSIRHTVSWFMFALRYLMNDVCKQPLDLHAKDIPPPPPPPPPHYHHHHMHKKFGPPELISLISSQLWTLADFLLALSTNIGLVCLERVSNLGGSEGHALWTTVRDRQTYTTGWPIRTCTQFLSNS